MKGQTKRQPKGQIKIEKLQSALAQAAKKYVYWADSLVTSGRMKVLGMEGKIIVVEVEGVCARITVDASKKSLALLIEQILGFPVELFFVDMSPDKYRRANPDKPVRESWQW